jgi:hypothetical protein
VGALLSETPKAWERAIGAVGTAVLALLLGQWGPRTLVGPLNDRVVAEHKLTEFGLPSIGGETWLR